MNACARRAALLLGALGAGCAAPQPDAWHDLLRGDAAAGWSVTDFGGQGAVRFAAGVVQFDMGSPLTGITWTRPFPTFDYELALQATRTLGNDFVLGLTFPVGDAHLTLVLGGWGGTVCGLSCLDGLDAARNDTRRLRNFPAGKPCAVEVSVRSDHVNVQLDGAPFLDVDLTGRALTLRNEMLPCRPLGCASYLTGATLRDLRWRPLPPR